jgi:hypothetical protein
VAIGTYQAGLTMHQIAKIVGVTARAPRGIILGWLTGRHIYVGPFVLLLLLLSLMRYNLPVGAPANYQVVDVVRCLAVVRFRAVGKATIALVAISVALVIFKFVITNVVVLESRNVRQMARVVALTVKFHAVTRVVNREWNAVVANVVQVVHVTVAFAAQIPIIYAAQRVADRLQLVATLNVVAAFVLGIRLVVRPRSNAATCAVHPASSAVMVAAWVALQARRHANLLVQKDCRTEV